MKKLAFVSFSLVTLTSLALAQTPAPPAKGAPAVPADKKAPPAADKAAPTAAIKPAPPAEKPMPPKPPEVPAELVTLGKQSAGAWKCTGQAMMGESMIDVKGTVTNKVDATLNKFWIQSTLVGTAAKMPPMRGVWYTTYDAGSSKLWRVNLNARGGHSTAWGTIADKKIMWEGDARWGGTDYKTKTTEEWVSPKELKVSSEASKDGGKTWAKELDTVCKK
jgi:hypothetical protein